MDGFDTSNLSKEGLESLNVMQQVVPNAEAVFAAAEASLSNISFAGVEDADNVSLQVNTDASSGRASFNYTVDGETISFELMMVCSLKSFTMMNVLPVILLNLQLLKELQNMRFPLLNRMLQLQSHSLWTLC